MVIAADSRVKPVMQKMMDTMLESFIGRVSARDGETGMTWG